MKRRRAGTRQGEKRKNNRKGSAEGDSGSILRCSKRTGLAVASECKRPTWVASPKQKHPCWGAISFSFIKKRRKHPEVCPSGKGNSPCRRLASGRTLCDEFANRACCRKRPTWMASPKQKHPCWGAFVLEAPPGIGPGIKVLQTSALPLGYGALSRIQKKCMLYI